MHAARSKSGGEDAKGVIDPQSTKLLDWSGTHDWPNEVVQRCRWCSEGHGYCLIRRLTRHRVLETGRLRGWFIDAKPLAVGSVNRKASGRKQETLSTWGMVHQLGLETREVTRVVLTYLSGCIRKKTYDCSFLRLLSPIPHGWQTETRQPGDSPLHW